MTKKKVKVRVKKRKLNVKRIFCCLIVIFLFGIAFYFIKKLPIKNIYILDNDIIPDKEIIDLSLLNNYPSFLDTSASDIAKRIKENEYIKDVKVLKKIYGKIYIYVKEKKILCLYNDKLIMEDGSLIINKYNNYDYPTLISDISAIYDKFTTKFSKVDKEVLLKISQIEYVPNDVDNERFSLMMNDGNLVYITLSKISKINRYNSIYSSMNGKKGIVYLDSGDYVEIKEN